MGLAAAKASSILWCVSKRITRPRDMITPLHSALVRPHLEKCSAFVPKFKRDIEKMVRVQWRASKVVTELENLTYEEMLMEFNLFNPQDRRLRGNLITVHQYLKYIYREDRGTFFTKKHGDKKRVTSCFMRNCL